MLNFALGTMGLIMLGFGVCLLVESNEISAGGGDDKIPQLFQLKRTMLVELGLPNDFVDKLPRSWYYHVIIFIIVNLLYSFFLHPWDK